MELLVLEKNIEKDFSNIAIIDFHKLTEQVKNNPEDYIFIFDSEEHSKFMEINAKVFALSASHGKEKFILNPADYTDKNQGVITVCYLLTRLEFAKKYKAGVLTHNLIAPGYAVFFIRRDSDEKERTKEVLQRITSFRAGTSQDGKQN